jgi:hypothetical protein
MNFQEYVHRSECFERRTALALRSDLNPKVAKDREADIINVGMIRYPDIIGRQHKAWDEGSGYIPQS